MANIKSINGNPIVLDSSGLESNAVTTQKMADNAVIGDKINDNAVRTSKLADGAVTTVKMANSSVATGKIANKAVTGPKIADGAVTYAQISTSGNSRIHQDNINDNAVSTRVIADGAVTDAKLANGGVKATKIPWPVNTSKLGRDGQILATHANGAVEWVDQQLPSEELMRSAVVGWLDEHPEATTTVQDGALTEPKFHPSFSLELCRCFDSTTNMQAATDLKVGMIAHTNGFHVSGDGGAAYYTVSASGTANGMDVLACAGGLYATLVVTEPYVTPEMFGAYGNGTHDDTDSLQKALSASAPVYLLNQYAISAPVDASGIVIGGSKCLITTVDKSTRTISAFFNHADDLYIEGVTFDCMCDIAYTESDYQTFYNVGISSVGTNYALHVESCMFDNVYTSAINMHNCAGEVIIDNCRFNPASGNATVAEYIRLTSSNSDNIFAVRSCVFVGTFGSTNNYCGIYLATMDRRKEIVIESNVLDGLGRKGTHRLGAIDCYSLVHNVKVKNNQITNCAWNAMRMHTCSNSEIANNYITMDASRERLSEWCIIVSNNLVAGEALDFDGITIRGNTIKCVGAYQQQAAIQIVTADATKKITNCVIEHNNISGTFIDGIHIDSIVADALVIGNTVNGGVQNCIQLIEADYTDTKITIRDNILDGRQPIFHRNTGGGNIEILSNILKSSTGFCVNATGATPVIVGNSMSGVNGSSGGKLVGFNNLHDLTGSYGITNATTMFANYKDGAAI